LSTQFPVEAQKPLDLNTAPAVELESVAGLLRKESAALIAHREKNGPCKKLDDLKTVGRSRLQEDRNAEGPARLYVDGCARFAVRNAIE
jgi:DNA uptake protein ComE-like DNA-binding protein